MRAGDRPLSAPKLSVGGCYNIVLTILEQEVEHEEDLQALLEDFELMARAFQK